jgi:hypothetical protein
VGDECSGDAACCDGTLCSSMIYGEGDAIISSYCAPECGGDGDCECDHTCEVVGSIKACVPTGTAKGMFDVTVWTNTVRPGQDEDLDPVSFQMSFDGKTYQVTNGSGLYEIKDLIARGDDAEDYVAITFQANSTPTDAWFLHIVVHKDNWKAGTLETSVDDVSTGFNAYLLKGAVAMSQIQRLWIEGIANSGTLTIEETGEPCPGDVCPTAKGSFELDFAGLRVEVSKNAVNFAAVIV